MKRSFRGFTDIGPELKFLGVAAVLAAVMVLVPLGGAAAFFTGLLDSVLGGAEEEIAAEMEDGEGGPHEILFLDLPEMLVNLNTGDDRTVFLKVKVSLELNSAEAMIQLEALMPRVVDNFQVYLRELRLEDLAGSAGLFRLKEELLFRVNRAVDPIQVSDILFREMLVQ